MVNHVKGVKENQDNLLPQLQPHHRLTVAGLGKHIHRPCFDDFILFGEQGQVPRLGAWITGNVDDDRGGELQQHRDHLGVHARPGRVGDEDVRAAVLGRKLGREDVFGTPGVPGTIVEAIELGVDFSVVDGGRDFLDTDHCTCVLRHKLTNGTYTRVKVVDVLISRQARVLGGDFVEALPLPRIGLKKGLWPDVKAHVAKRFLDGGGAREEVHLQVHHVFVDLTVDAVIKAGEVLAEFSHDGIEERLDLVLIVLKESKHQHALTRAGSADHELAKKADPLAHIKEGNLHFDGQGTDAVAQLVAGAVLEVTFFDINQLVVSACFVETDDVHLVGHGIITNFVGGEPAAVRNAKFEFIAIEAGVFAAENRLPFTNFHLADARERIAHHAVFLAQLAFVAEVLPLTTAANTEVLTERLYPVFALFMKLKRSTEKHLLFFAEGAHIYHVSGYDFLDEDDHTFVSFAYAEALIGQAGDGYVVNALGEAVATVTAHFLD